jgi:hypothetical protein
MGHSAGRRKPQPNGHRRQNGHHRKPRKPWDRAKTVAGEVRSVLMDHYHGPLPDDDAGNGHAELMVRYLVAQKLDGVSEAEHFLATSCPLMPPSERAQLLQRTRRLPPPRFKADTLAQRLGVTYPTRQRLKLTQIGAIDVPQAERKRLKKERDRERCRLRRQRHRRDQGVPTREEYLATCLSRTKPWQAEGVSRATWYRKAATPAAVPS